MKKYLLLLSIAVSCVAQNVVATGQGTSDAVADSGVSISSLAGAIASANMSATVTTQLVSGGQLEYLSGLTYTVGAATYYIAGVKYTSAAQNVTLTAADMTNPRIEIITLDSTGTASVLPGTPANPAVAPAVDPSTLLALTSGISVAAGATTPSGAGFTLLYDEGTGAGGGEWTAASTANVNTTSSSTPYLHTHDIEFTNAVLGNNATLTKPTGSFDLSTANSLYCYVRSKAAWPTGNSGATALRTLSFWWLNGAAQVGLQFVLQTGVQNFNSGTTSNYQQVGIPLASFGVPQGTTVTALRIQVTGRTGTSTIGLFIDDCTLQGGTAPLSLPQTLMNSQGTYNSSKAYNPNDVIVNGSSGAYLATIANTNSAPLNNSTWASLSPAFVCAEFVMNGQGSVLTTGDLNVFPTANRNATITRIDVSGNPSGSATMDIWKRAGAIPTGAQKISASAPATLSSSALSQNGSLTGWTTSVAVGDVWGATLVTATTVTSMTVQIWCQ